MRYFLDQSGKVRIWDTVNKEHLLKNEFQPISGPIKDITWSMDNQRMVVVGEGRERFGHVFMVETGTSVGEISGQSKPINSSDFRPVRPFRIITGNIYINKNQGINSLKFSIIIIIIIIYINHKSQLFAYLA